jgi:PAS domain S-box-containing protein
MTEPDQTAARMLMIVEAAPNAIILVDTARKIVTVNAQAEKLFGYSRTELLGQPVEMLIPHRSRDRHPDLCQDFNRNPTKRPMGIGRDLSGLRKDGAEVPIEIGLTTLQTGEGTFVLASIIDITLRKRAEETLVQERNLLRTLIDNLPDYIFVKDREHRFLTANMATARLMGCLHPTELLGKRDEDFYPSDLGQEFQSDEEKVFRGQPIINKDEPHTDKLGCRREILTSKFPLRDSTGNIVGLVGVSRDITELKRKELALQSALAQQEKLVADLQSALDHVKTLQGLLPICGFCHKIRNADGTWERLESFISSRTDAGFTHSFCPDCGHEHYGAFLPPKP